MACWCPDWSDRASFYVAAFGMAVCYEWSALPDPLRLQAQARAYRHLYSNHRLHHFRNEKYWFGITNTLGDRVHADRPDKEDVPVSPTAKNLHGGVHPHRRLRAHG